MAGNYINKYIFTRLARRRRVEYTQVSSKFNRWNGAPRWLYQSTLLYSTLGPAPALPNPDGLHGKVKNGDFDEGDIKCEVKTRVP